LKNCHALILPLNLGCKGRISSFAGFEVCRICVETIFIYFCDPESRPEPSGGHFFEGDVAQLVEQRTENPCVGGSIPSVTTLAAIALAKAAFS
jgi:hypothetical protein